MALVGSPWAPLSGRTSPALRFASVFALLFHCLPCFAQPKLEFDSTPIGDVNVWLDSPASCGRVTSEDLKDTVRAVAGVYEIFSKPPEGFRNPLVPLTYDFYVRRIDAPSDIFCFSAKARQGGPFLDGRARFRFQIIEEHIQSGAIDLPVYCNCATTQLHSLGYNLRPDSEHLYFAVRSGERKEISLELVNRHESFNIRINNVDVDPTNAEHWVERVPIWREGGSDIKTLRPGPDNSVKVHLRTDGWKALRASFLPIDPKKPHQFVTLLVDYDTPGAIRRQMRVEIPVRFIPSFWALAAGLVGGALVGSVLSSLLPSYRGKWFRDALAAVLISIIFELVAIVLYSLGNRVQILGFDLDPFELIPVFLLGVLVGLSGFKTVDAVLSFLGRKPAGAAI